MSRCKSCGAEITWAVTQQGRVMPLDAAKVLVAIPTGRFVDNGSGQLTPQVEVRQASLTHFATCPHAQQHRKPRQAGVDRDPRVPARGSDSRR